MFALFSNKILFSFTPKHLKTIHFFLPCISYLFNLLNKSLLLYEVAFNLLVPRAHKSARIAKIPIH